MNIAYFYRGNHTLVHSAYCNTLEDVIKTPTDYYTGYERGDIISLTKYENPFIENGEVREATKEENIALGRDVYLSDGEYVEDGVLKVIEKPSSYHEWKDGEWVIDVERVREKIRNQLKSRREEALNENLRVPLKAVNTEEFKEYEFQMREKDIKNFENLKNMLDILKTLGADKKNFESKGEKVLNGLGADPSLISRIKEFLTTGLVGWVMADNSVSYFTFDTIQFVQALYYIRKEEVFSKFISLSNKLDKAVSSDDFNSIVWEG